MKVLLLMVVSLAVLESSQAGKKCLKELEEKAGTDEWKPACDEGGKYLSKQCNEDKCWCVRRRKGKPAYKNLQVPLGEEYDCETKPTKCQKERFQKLIEKSNDLTAPDCDDEGDFVACPTYLEAGDKLYPGEKLCSPNGEYVLILQEDGNLVEYNTADNSAVWSTNVLSDVALLAMQNDGNLVIYDVESTARWAINKQVDSPSHLEISDDGGLAVMAEDGSAYWTKETCPRRMWPGEWQSEGFKLCSANGMYTAVLQSDGNFVIYTKDGGVYWAANKHGDDVRIVFQGDGNLVIYAKDNRVVWAANKQGTPKSVNMQNDGNLVVYDQSGKALWASKW